MGLREIRYKHMKQTVGQFCICGAIAFVNVPEE